MRSPSPLVASSSRLRRSVSFQLPSPELHPQKPAEKSIRSSSPPFDSPQLNSPSELSPEPSDDSRDARKGILPGPRRRKLAFLNPVLVLENSGSVARDHLASERTFLAYVRTSLAIASTGVALVQLFTVSTNAASQNLSATQALGSRIRSFARPLGSASVCLGILVLLVGILRYFTVQHALTQGSFPVTRVLIAGIALILLAIVTIVFAVLVTGHR
ncbi:hypothetical protein D9757_004097 [Collybiopsis confluens]|uniref:DUF202 domain-containing protein n=1 Tax=Collybiopsis confluens TaxID=2823264 RepID=A0A8H5HUP5_9AGAR|nr:hypothetical protein D9757_004097 [Collybiopsis confluens]